MGGLQSKINVAVEVLQDWRVIAAIVAFVVIWAIVKRLADLRWRTFPRKSRNLGTSSAQASDTEAAETEESGENRRS
jgi:hypothetical protein